MHPSEQDPAVPFILKIKCSIDAVSNSFKLRDSFGIVFELMLKVVMQSVANFLLLARWIFRML